jgi:hypothetical protein
MNFGRFLFKLLLLAGVIVSLGLSYVTSPAAEQRARQTPAAAAPANPSGGRASRPVIRASGGRGHAEAAGGSGHGGG